MTNEFVARLSAEQTNALTKWLLLKPEERSAGGVHGNHPRVKFEPLSDGGVLVRTIPRADETE